MDKAVISSGKIAILVQLAAFIDKRDAFGIELSDAVVFGLDHLLARQAHAAVLAALQDTILIQLPAFVHHAQIPFVEVVHPIVGLGNDFAFGIDEYIAFLNLDASHAFVETGLNLLVTWLYDKASVLVHKAVQSVRSLLGLPILRLQAKRHCHEQQWEKE